MKRWRKLHTRRSHRFEALPLVTRGLLMELVAHVDDDGWLRLGTKDRSALWRHLAAHSTERRHLSKHLDALVANGSVVESEEGWHLPSFVAYQEDEDAKPKRARRAAGAPSPRPGGALDVSCARSGDALDVLSVRSGRAVDVLSIEDNCAESFEADRENRIEESRTDKSRVEVVPLALTTQAPKRKKAAPAAPKVAATWDAYSSAFRARYGAEPVRNAKVNSQLKQLVERLGADDAPHVAAFYVSHNGSYYVSRGHAVGFMLTDAEKLHMEWSTGRRITRGAARDAEVFDELRDKDARVEEFMRGLG